MIKKETRRTELFETFFVHHNYRKIAPFFLRRAQILCRKYSRIVLVFPQYVLRFCFTTLCDWSRKLAPLSQPIRCKTRTNRDLVTSISRARGGLRVFILSPHWLILIFTVVLIGCCDVCGVVLDTQSQTALLEGKGKFSWVTLANLFRCS